MAYIKCPHCDAAPRERDFAAHVRGCRKADAPSETARLKAENKRLKLTLRETLVMLHDALAEAARAENLVNTLRRALAPESQQ